jgi:hypothetical protein
MSCRFAGWLAVLPFAGWCYLYGDRAAARSLAIALVVALVTFVDLNPAIWHEPLGGLVKFMQMNTHRKLSVATQFFGRGYDLEHSLPWYNTLYWTAATVPTGTLALGAIGIARVLRRWVDDAPGMLLVLNWLTLIAVRALPGAPPHDAERLILPSFPFFGALAGIGCQTVLGWARSPSRKRAARVCLGAALLGSASSVFWYAPQWLTYYSVAAGGLRGAARDGMEPTYYWDSLDREVLDWLHANTPANANNKFSPMSGENLIWLHRWGLLRRATEQNDPGRYRWYVSQRRPSFMSPVDHYLDKHETPVFSKFVRGCVKGAGPWRTDVPLLKIFSFEQFERARRALGAGA